MNTPAHLIFAATAFARPERPGTTLAALTGALMPDLSLYVMAAVSLFILGMNPEYVFGTLYFSDTWQQVFKIDNSFILWGVAFGVAWVARATTAMVFAASGLLHLAFDFPLHHDDGRAHFWPVSDWVFQSPVSYWDNLHYGGVIAPIEIVVSLFFCVLLFRRFQGMWPRMAICAAASMQALPGIIWAFVFASNAV